MSQLFKPIQLRHKTLKNRVVFGAHTTNMSERGLPGRAHQAYYHERAKGGAAMIVVEPMPVHAAARLTRGNFIHSTDEVIPHFRHMIEPSQAEGAVMIQQLYHIGAHGDSDLSFHPHWSPSGGPSYHDGDGSHKMTAREIEETITGFVQAARRCYEAGFDGVEVWAAYHGLLDQFWTPFSNHRDDEWGGSLENRTRFSREVLSRIRKACGDDFIIGLAVNDEPDVEVALSREATAEIVALHDERDLMDYVTCGSGGYFDFYKLMPTFLYAEKLGADLAQTLKTVTKNALITAESHIRTPDNAASILSAGEADLVSIVRGQIADPLWVNKAQAGAEARIRPCLSCNQMCWGRRGRDYWISCVINPAVGREAEWQAPTPMAQATKILVVGGGPAGLEAARMAAEFGGNVTLVEAAPQLGGQFLLAGTQPRRGQINDLIRWYENELERLGIDVQLNRYLEAEEIAEYGADHVILATGSRPEGEGFQKSLPHFQGLKGFEKQGVGFVDAYLSREMRPGKRVIVFDEAGGWPGCGTAWKLAEEGHDVTLVTPDPMVGRDLQRMAADLPLRRNLAAKNVKFITEHAMLEWTGDHLILLNLLNGAHTEITAETLLIANTRIANSELAEALDAEGQIFHLIGDAAAPRQAAFAIYEGQNTVRNLFT